MARETAAERRHRARETAAERREMEREAERERWEVEQDRKDRWFYSLLFGGFTVYLILLNWFTN